MQTCQTTHIKYVLQFEVQFKYYCLPLLHLKKILMSLSDVLAPACRWQQLRLVVVRSPAVRGSTRLAMDVRTRRYATMCWRRPRCSPRSTTCSSCAPLRSRMHALAPACASGGRQLQTLARLARQCIPARVCPCVYAPLWLVRVWPHVYTTLALVLEQECHGTNGQTS
jgi:hypothetical protein